MPLSTLPAVFHRLLRLPGRRKFVAPQRVPLFMLGATLFALCGSAATPLKAQTTVMEYRGFPVGADGKADPATAITQLNGSSLRIAESGGPAFSPTVVINFAVSGPAFPTSSLITSGDYELDIYAFATENDGTGTSSEINLNRPDSVAYVSLIQFDPLTLTYNAPSQGQFIVESSKITTQVDNRYEAMVNAGGTSARAVFTKISLFFTIVGATPSFDANMMVFSFSSGQPGRQVYFARSAEVAGDMYQWNKISVNAPLTTTLMANDGVLVDMVLRRQNSGVGGGNQAPEPGSLLLSLCGFAALATVLRRRSEP